MNKTMIAAALAAGVMFGYSGRAWTQTDCRVVIGMQGDRDRNVSSARALILRRDASSR